eukprot:357369-Chlamydomonas_euryale.AAC.3
MDQTGSARSHPTSMTTNCRRERKAQGPERGQIKTGNGPDGCMTRGGGKGGSKTQGREKGNQGTAGKHSVLSAAFTWGIPELQLQNHFCDATWNSDSACRSVASAGEPITRWGISTWS